MLRETAIIIVEFCWVLAVLDRTYTVLQPFSLGGHFMQPLNLYGFHVLLLP